MYTIRCNTVLAATLAVLAYSSTAFVTPAATFLPSGDLLSSSSRTILFAQDPSSSDDASPNAFDLEAARRRLEELVESGGGGGGSLAQEEKTPSNQHHPIPPTPPPSPPRSLFNLFFGPKQSSSQEDKDKHHDADTSLERAFFASIHFEGSHDAYNDVTDAIDLYQLNGPLRNALLASTLQEEMPMTAIELERRQTEIQLLQQLAEDDNDDKLWDLWFHEQGPAAARQLQDLEPLLADPERWNEAQQALIAIVQEYGTRWAEPLNRLATLYYMQGRLGESEQLCRIVLSIKPWHVGALSGIVMVYAQLHETELARTWAARRLPSLAPPPSLDGSSSPFAASDRLNSHSAGNTSSSNRRRQLWVHSAVEQATARIEDKLRQRGEWWGPPDERRRHRDFPSSSQDNINAWQ